MPLMKLRGEQLKDGVILNRHIGEKIVENNLDINWAAHYNEALKTRKLIDFVQVSGVTVAAGASEVNLTAVGIIPASDPKTGSNDINVEGVIIDAPKNKAAVRNAETGEPLYGPNGEEVYGRVIFDESANAFKLQLFYFDSQAEVAFAPAADVQIDFQYARRFNLADVDELFAANEKFVEGAADITAHLNIVQLAKDLYGPGYSLDRDGNANLSKSLVEQLAEEITRATAAEEALGDRIDAEANARQQAITNLYADLASNEAGKGASLIGIADVEGKFQATTVEAALLELKNDIANLVGGGDSGLSLASLDARLDAVEAEIATARGEYANLDARLDAIDAAIAAETSRAQQAEADLQAAIDSEASARQAADQNLQNQINALTADYNAHKWSFYKFTVPIDAESSVVNIPAEKPAFTPGNGSLCVFLNGVLQEEGVNYAELPDGRGVDFTPEVLQPGDKVTFWYYINA